jgi:hypothetical protein
MQALSCDFYNFMLPGANEPVCQPIRTAAVNGSACPRHAIYVGLLIRLGHGQQKLIQRLSRNIHSAISRKQKRSKEHGQLRFCTFMCTLVERQQNARLKSC